MGTAIKYPVPERVQPSFVIFDIWALWRSAGPDRMPKITNDSCSHMSTVGVKGLTHSVTDI